MRHTNASLLRSLVAIAVLCAAAPAKSQSVGGPSAAPTATYAPPLVGDLPPAPPPKPLGEALTGIAKTDYEAALLLHQSGDFGGAAVRFQSAYDASKDVRLLWNAAACEQSLRHYAKAIVLVRRYLDSRSPLITAEAERNALAFLDAAIPLTARLIVESNEAGASVYLNDEHVGALPLDPDLRVDFGAHRILLLKPGFTEARQRITVTSTADVRVNVRLQPVVHRGRLVVRAGKGDSIALDGHFVGLSTFDGAVPSGPHRLKVTAAGSKAFETRVMVEDDRTRAMDVVLEPAPSESGFPTWAWVAGGAALLAGAATVGYFALKSDDPPPDSGSTGTLGRVELEFR